MPLVPLVPAVPGVPWGPGGPCGPTAPALPLGLPLDPGVPEVAVESLEPGDQLFVYTDGFPEARLPNGELFGMERLIAFLEREAAAERPVPETLRRLRRVLLDEERSRLRDDAVTMV